MRSTTPDVDESTVIHSSNRLFFGCVKLKRIGALIRLFSIDYSSIVDCIMLDKSFVIEDIEDDELRTKKMSFIGISKNEFERLF